MSQRLEVPWPEFGICDDQAHAKQPELTTAESTNCRTRQSETRRAQGGQRPGYSNLTASPMGAPVKAMSSVAVDLPKVRFFGPNQLSVDERWDFLSPSGVEALDVTTDFEGNVYIVDPTGVFVMLGPDGTEEVRLTFHVPAREGVVPRIQVDEDQNVYVATTHPQGYSARVLRFERVEFEKDEKVHFQEAWNYAGLWGIRDFRVSGGLCVVARFFSKQSENEPPADVMRLGLLSAPQPTPIDSAPTPWPVSMIAMNDAGEILGAAPANSDRNQGFGDEGWYAPVESWSPHELESVNGSGAAERLHFWIDPRTLANDHVDGTPIRLVPDRRWLDTSLDFEDTDAFLDEEGALSGGGSVAYAPVFDQVSRPLRSRLREAHEGNGPLRLGGNFGFNPAEDDKVSSFFYPDRPTFKPRGAGLTPTIHFPGINGASLQTDFRVPNTGKKSDTDADGDPNADGVMPKQRALFPTHEDKVFCTILAIRYNFDSHHGGVVFHHRTKSGMQVALIVNADEGEVYGQVLTGANTSGRLTLYVADADYTASNGGITGAVDGGDGGARVASCDLTAADFANSKNMAIVVIQHPGANVTGKGLFRVNGYTVDRFTWTDGSSPAHSTMFGSSEGGQINYNMVFGGKYDVGRNQAERTFSDFEGELCGCLTLLGSSSGPNSPNDTPVTFPAKTSDGLPADPGAAIQWTNMTSFNYSTNPNAYTDAASEIERLEGWMAYLLGCPDVLKSIPAAPSQSDGLWNGHPFGLTSSGDSQPPVGSSAAGNEILTETGQALLSSKEILFKIGASGDVLWAIEGGGHGLGVAAGPGRAVLAVGDKDTAASSNVVAKRLIDLGSSVVETGDDTWQLEETGPVSTKAVRGLVADQRGNLYWPRPAGFDSFRLEITAYPGFTGTDTLTITRTDGGTAEDYVMQAPGGLGGSDGVLCPTGDLEGIARNIAAAINDDGVEYTGPGPTAPYAQYDPRDAHPDVRATVELEDGSVFLRIIRKTEAGTVTVSRNSGWLEIEFEDDSTADSRTLEAGTRNRVEVRAAETGDLLWGLNFGLGLDTERPLAIALNPIVPVYDDEDLDGTAEHLYVAFQNDSQSSSPSSPTGPTLRKYAHVGRRQVIDQDLSPRRTFQVAAAGGSLYQIIRGEVPIALSTGIGVLQAESPFTKLWPYRQRVYGLDGQGYIRWDPKTKQVSEWRAEGAGEIPYGAKLGCTWGTRIALGRTADDPHNFHLSESGNPDGWNTSPGVITPLAAFSGSGSGNLHFRKHDLLNTIIPASADYLILGGDQSVQVLVGDPGLGASVETYTAVEGLAFGDSWCQGPGGEIYAKGINAGIWRLTTNGDADRISLLWIERRLQAIDLEQYDVRLAWSFEQEGLHVYVVPKGVGERLVKHYFWDARAAFGGWWEDEFVSTGLQPTCVAVFDGDKADDRMVAIGCEDGHVRREDRLAKNDGDERIVSSVLLGPFSMREHKGRVALSKLEVVLASEYDGCKVELYTDNVADFKGGTAPAWSGEARAGFEGFLRARARGNYAWVRLSNGALGESWALETLAVHARRAGRRRRVG